MLGVTPNTYGPRSASGGAWKWAGSFVTGCTVVGIVLLLGVAAGIAATMVPSSTSRSRTRQRPQTRLGDVAPVGEPFSFGVPVPVSAVEAAMRRRKPTTLADDRSASSSTTANASNERYRRVEVLLEPRVLWERQYLLFDLLPSVLLGPNDRPSATANSRDTSAASTARPPRVCWSGFGGVGNKAVASDFDPHRCGVVVVNGSDTGRAHPSFPNDSYTVRVVPFPLARRADWPVAPPAEETEAPFRVLVLVGAHADARHPPGERRCRESTALPAHVSAAAAVATYRPSLVFLLGDEGGEAYCLSRTIVAAAANNPRRGAVSDRRGARPLWQPVVLRQYSPGSFHWERFGVLQPRVAALPLGYMGSARIAQVPVASATPRAGALITPRTATRLSQTNRSNGGAADEEADGSDALSDGGFRVPRAEDGATVPRASTRPFVWSFVGGSKNRRREMVDVFRDAFPERGQGYAALDEGFSVERMTRLYERSQFVLSPRGFSHLDCFRLYEACRAGAIPVVLVSQAVKAHAAWGQFPGVSPDAPLPFIIASSWAQAAQRVSHLRNGGSAGLDRQQAAALDWWANVRAGAVHSIRKALVGSLR